MPMDDGYQKKNIRGIPWIGNQANHMMLIGGIIYGYNTDNLPFLEYLGFIV